MRLRCNWFFPLFFFFFFLMDKKKIFLKFMARRSEEGSSSSNEKSVEICGGGRSWCACSASSSRSSLLRYFTLTCDGLTGKNNQKIPVGHTHLLDTFSLLIKCLFSFFWSSNNMAELWRKTQGFSLGNAYAYLHFYVKPRFLCIAALLLAASLYIRGTRFC